MSLTPAVRRSVLRWSFGALAAATVAPAMASATVVTLARFTSFHPDLVVTEAAGYKTFVNDLDVSPAGPGSTAVADDVTLAPGTMEVTYRHTFLGGPLQRNRMAFDPTDPYDHDPLLPGDQVRLGLLTLQNGVWGGGRARAEFQVEVRQGGAQVGTWIDELWHQVTENRYPTATEIANNTGPTADDRADIFSFVNNRQLGNIRVREHLDGGSGILTVAVYGRIGSLTPSRLEVLDGDGFIEAATPVPVPSTAWLLPAALAACVLGRRRPRPIGAD